MRINRKTAEILKQNSRGITLVALVVTIIVLLILAGITIATLFGDNGIINKAQKAKDEQLRANEQERLDLVKMEVAAKNEGKVDIDDYIQEVIDKGITDKVEDKEDGSKEFETDTGFDVTVKPNPDNENDVIIIIGGGGGNSSGGDKTKAPTIKEIAVTSGVDNIKVDVKTENADGATYKYYYKTDEDEEYTLAHEGKEPSYTIKQLVQDTKYTIKVEVSTKGGTATDEAIARTGEIPSAVGAITFTNSTWSGGKQSVTVTKTTTDNYKIEYQIMDENGNVKIDYTEIASGERIANLSHGDIVIARLTDGQNKGNSATYNVRDNTPPTVTVTKGTVTDSSIQVNASAVDNESGIPTSPSYKYYIKKSSITSYPTSSQTSNTFTGLEQNTSYDVKVETTDVAGNTGTGYLTGIETKQEIFIDNDLITPPKVRDGMTPIKWNGDEWIDTNIGDKEWYDYGNKKWANVRLNDGSMLVWIPRYAYKIISKWNTNSKGSIDIVFVDKNNKNKQGEDCGVGTYADATTGIGTTRKMKNYVINPAFNYATTQDGFWVGKFEISDAGEETIQIKPNKISWRGVTPELAFTKCIDMNKADNLYGLNSDDMVADPHLIKNVEWGAVAYLSQSKYGNTSVYPNNSKDYITGSGAYETEDGMKTSTTGNIYGVYDMNSGALEYTAAYLDNTNGKTTRTTYGNSLVKANVKYKDVYSPGSPDTAQNNWNATRNKFGDAIYETSGAGENYGYSWQGDSQYPYMSDAFFVRGESGIFGFTRAYVGNMTHRQRYGFRVIIGVF